MANGPGSITEGFASRRSGFVGNDIAPTSQAKDIDGRVGHRYAVSGNTTTAYVGVDECYRTYAEASQGPL